MIKNELTEYDMKEIFNIFCGGSQEVYNELVLFYKNIEDNSNFIELVLDYYDMYVEIDGEDLPRWENLTTKQQEEFVFITICEWAAEGTLETQFGYC